MTMTADTACERGNVVTTLKRLWAVLRALVTGEVRMVFGRQVVTVSASRSDCGVYCLSVGEQRAEVAARWWSGRRVTAARLQRVADRLVSANALP